VTSTDRSMAIKAQVQTSVTPIFRRETKCISYVRQDQFTHI
jgi:hypothetical protein